MGGYFIGYGYRGLVHGKWLLFASDTEYFEYLQEDLEDPNK